MQFRCTVLENGIEHFPHTVCSDDDLYPVCTFSIGQNETLAAQKLKELQGPKSRSQPLPRDAMLPPNEMRFCCTVLEKCHQNFLLYKLHGGKHYKQPFAHNSSLEGAKKLKFVPFCSS